jgi:hypothetical protein
MALAMALTVSVAERRAELAIAKRE